MRLLAPFPLIVWFIFASSTALAAKPAPAPAPAAARVLRVRLAQDLVTLDWAKSTSEVDRPLLANLHEGLFALDAKGRATPRLATKTVALDGGRRHRITLREGVKWSDGTPFRAQHALDGLKRLLSPYTASPHAPLLFDVVGAEAFASGKSKAFETVAIRAPDDRTLEIELTRAIPDWATTLAQAATFPVRDDLIRRLGDAWTRPGNLVVLGAFVLQQHEFGRSLTLQRNPHFFDRRGNVDRIEFAILNDEETRKQFGAGTIDVAFQLSSALRSSPPKTAREHSLPMLRVKRLSFNVKKFPISDASVRRMIAGCLDRDALAKAVGPGYRAGRSLAPPLLPEYDSSGGIAPEVSRSRRSFRENLTMMTALKLSLVIPAFDENATENEATARLLSQQLESCLKVPLEVAQAQDAQQWALLSRSGTFSLILHDWKPEAPEASRYYSLYASDSRFSAQWSDAEYDRLLQQARALPAGTARNQAYRSADRILTRDQIVMIPLFYAPEPVWTGPRVRSFSPSTTRPYSLTEAVLK